MQLHWIHNQAEKLLKCVVFNDNKFNQELYYTTSDGGTVINKYFNDVLMKSFVKTPESDPWEDEKEWLRRENHFLREKIKQLNDEIKNYQKYIEAILKKLEKYERD